MMRRWWPVILLLTGCTPHDDIRARYQIERRLWHAQFYQRRVNIAFLSGTSRDMENAILAYRAVVAADPFAHSSHPDWDPAVSAEIRDLIVSSRVALANLYFATERYADAGTLYAQTLQLGSLNFKDMLDARMGAARVSYMEGDSRSVITQCTNIFRDVNASPRFWSGKGNLDDVFLNIPVALVQFHQEDGAFAAADSASASAMAFYRRVSNTWPGTRTDWQARMATAQLHMLQGDWRAALSDLENILADSKQQAGDAAGLELVAGEIQAFRLQETEAGRARFLAVQTRHPGSFAAFASMYDLAAMREPTDPDGAAEEFRKVEGIAGVPDAVAARAMLARAGILERRDDWEEAFSILRRIEQLYPFTAAGMEAPLLVTRHYARTGPREMLDMSLAHAREYYNSLLDRTSTFTGNRAVAQASLVESFLAAGEADEAVRALVDETKSWDDASTATGMLRAAELYHEVLHDDAAASATLQKVITRFRGTRFAALAAERLAALSTS